MKKKSFTPRSLLLTIGALTILFGPMVAAAGECPSSCTAGSFTIQSVDPFPRLITEATPGDGTTYTCSSYPCYIWEYEFTSGDPSTISQAMFDLPVCCGGSLTILGGDPQVPPSNIYAPCAGDPTTEWGKYICDIFVAKLTAQIVNGPQNRFWFATSQASIGLITMAFKVGKNISACAIEGPECGIGGNYTPVVYEDVQLIKNTQIKILRDPSTGCGYNVLYYDTDSLDWVQAEIVTPYVDPGVSSQSKPIVDCGGTRALGRACRECQYTAASSPGWTYFTLGGVTYRVYIP